VNRETLDESRKRLQEGFLSTTRPGRPYPERRTGAANSCYPPPSCTTLYPRTLVGRTAKELSGVKETVLHKRSPKPATAQKIPITAYSKRHCRTDFRSLEV
jgi:hypothetical protein